MPDPRNPLEDSAEGDLELRPKEPERVSEGMPGASVMESPAGKMACASCMKVFIEAVVTLMPDGRYLCPGCVREHRREHGREESRVAATLKVPARWDLPELPAWGACIAVPAAGWLIFSGLAGGFRGGVALLSVVGVELVAVFLALMLVSMIFNGLDTPSIANRIWKLTAILVLDMILCFLAAKVALDNPCMLLGYLMVGRGICLATGLMMFLNLELIEAGAATVFATLIVLLLLVSSTGRALMLPFWGG